MGTQGHQTHFVNVIYTGTLIILTRLIIKGKKIIKKSVVEVMHTLEHRGNVSLKHFFISVGGLPKVARGYDALLVSTITTM